jgi:hypothetical protein
MDAICRHLPPAVMHTAPEPENAVQFSLRHLLLTQLKASGRGANFAQTLRYGFNVIQRILPTLLYAAKRRSTHFNIIPTPRESPFDFMARCASSRSFRPVALRLPP